MSDGHALPSRRSTAGPRSRRLFVRARRVLVGGVDSPVRAFTAVGGEPVFIARARGARLYDVDGRAYVDYVLSWGPLIHGHAPGGLVKQLAAAAARGLSFGAPIELEVALADQVRARLPSIERIRFVNSGTEATMSAVRVARAATGRTKLVKFEGCYHGHADAFLVGAGSGAATLGVPTSPGVPAAIARDTLIARYNDLSSVEHLFAVHGTDIAAVIVEPVAGNMGVVLPVVGFLEGLRELCDRHGALLIFDEVITGFRVAPGGAQTLFGVRPDLTCLGKILGGGVPIGAYGGRADLMELVAPSGPVYQAGTLAGNPLAMTAGLWTLRRLTPPLYRRLAGLGRQLAAGLADAARDAGVTVQINGVGSMLTPFFAAEPVRDYEGAARTDRVAYSVFFHSLLARGIYVPPSPFEAWFLSAAHTTADIDRTLAAARAAFRAVARARRGAA